MYRDAGRPIIYEDKTYIHSSHTPSKGWTDESTHGLLAPVSRGSRLIILHAGSTFGFVPNALAMFKSNQRTGDYHKSMNNTNYVTWLRKQLIPNLPPNSVLVIDNASYHNTQLNKPPTSTATNAKMISWLVQNGVDEDTLKGMRKSELFDLVTARMPRGKMYVIDQILSEYGHAVLRLPPYHPDLNPIELIWGDLKQWVARRNTTFKMKDVENLCRQGFSEIGEEKWRNACAHVQKIEDMYCEQEGVLEETIDRIIIQEGSDDEDGDEDEHNEMNSFEDEGSMSGVEELLQDDD